MKKGNIFILMVLALAPFIYAQGCDLSVSLTNQDPYPAVPGDYVKLVFQVEGVASTECGDVTFELPEQYPIEFDPGAETETTIRAGTYTRDYESFVMIPYKVRVDEDALDGDNPLEVIYTYSKGGTGATLSDNFNLNIEDTRVEFEVFVKDYDTTTKELTLEILNIGKQDIEALTVEIPEQENFGIKGPSKNIVGDLDSNEYTTADFEAYPQDGEFKVKLIYSDTVNVRRTIEKSVSFDSAYFTGRIEDQKTIGMGTYIFWAIVLVVLGWFIFRKIKKKKKRK